MRAVIFGCAGPLLEDHERAFFQEAQPWGFILFARNCQSTDQIHSLCRDLRETVNRPNAPILIDHEGGRVMRLTPPVWPARPPMSRFGVLYEQDKARAFQAAKLGAELLARDLFAAGVNVNCVPALDIAHPGAHDVIGDRALSDNPEAIEHLGKAVIEGTIAAGLLPVMKHLPGHGRAGADSHIELPKIDTTHAILSSSDFVPFKAHHDLLMGMTNHIVYTDIDPDNPTTLSKIVIDEIIRGEIGFDGLLMSDDFSMKALSGSFAERCNRAFATGCDIVLHCNGDMAEMQAITAHSPLLSGEAARRAARVDAALERLGRHKGEDEGGDKGGHEGRKSDKGGREDPNAANKADLEQRFAELMAPVWSPA